MDESTWKKEPASEGKQGSCLHCGPRPSLSLFPPNGFISVGFGYAGLHRDGKPVWSEPLLSANENESKGDYMTGAKAEELAAEDPDHDWRIVLEGPLTAALKKRADLPGR